MKHFRVSEAAGRARLISSTFLKDAFTTYDRATYDSAGAFLIGELERLDPTIHEPLVEYNWFENIDLRTDVQMGDTNSSFTTSTFGAAGGVTPSGIAWASAEATTLPRANLDIQKVVNPLHLWSHEVAYTVPELESARQTGRPLDTQMLSALNLKHQMDIDQMVFVGDSSISVTGLVNHTLVSNSTNVANGANSNPQWNTKTALEILTDFNEILTSAWKASAYKVPPDRVGVSPKAFGYLTTTLISSAGTMSVLEYVRQNNVFTAQFGRKIDIVPIKWLDRNLINGPTGSQATNDRMIAYTKKPEYVRYPMVPLQATQPQYRGLWIAVPYYGRLGCVEAVYPETIAYRDGIWQS